MRRFASGLAAALCFAVAGYALFVYALLPLGQLVHPAMREAFLARPLGIYLHVFAAVFALALGPLQFWKRLRTARPRLHRALGRAYLGIGVLIGGASGLYVAQFAFGGPVARIGFSLLALAWIGTGLAAYRAIRAGDVARHRAWMVRNFALTLAAVTLRIYLPLSMVAGIEFETAYRAIAWLCWVPNLAVAWFLTAGTLRTIPARSPASPCHQPG